MNQNDNPLLLINEINELSEHMELKEFHEAMDMVVKYLAKPEVLPDHRKVAVTLVQLSAYAALFRVEFANYMTWKKNTTNASSYKNTYKELYQGIDNLVDSLKYLAK